MHRVAGIIAVLLCMGVSTIGQASPVYYFTFDQARYDSGSGTYKYAAQPGETVTVNVYLYEYSAYVGETYMAPPPDNAAEGLQSAAIALDITSNTAGATLATITGNTVAFDDFQTYLSGQYDFTHDVGVMSFQDGYATEGAYGEVVDAETTRILVGTFTFEVPDEAAFGTTMTIEAADLYSTIADNVSFETLTDLDVLVQAGGYPEMLLTVVPEPPSVVALCGLAAMGGLMWVVRRARKVQQA